MEFFRHLKQGGKTTLLIALFVLGAVLLFFSATVKKEEPQAVLPADGRLPDDAAKQALEEELTGLICEMKGVSRARVSVTLESGNEYVYENGNNTLILTGRVRGVAVVCDGGNDPVIRERICSLLCALLDLPLRAVSVSE